MSPSTNVYLDSAFVINFIMDFLILWAAAKLGNLRTSFKKLCFGAIIGALYAIIIFLPNFSFFSGLFFKFLCSVLMVLVTYKPVSKRMLFKSFVYFYLVAFIAGGAVLGTFYLCRGPQSLETWNGIAVSTANFEAYWLLVGIGAVLVLIVWGASYIRRNLEQGPWIVKVNLELMDKTINLDALVDTGNQLTDPITKEPVMVIEHKKMINVLPQEFIKKIEENKDTYFFAGLLDLVKGSEWETRLRVIPFSSLGNQNGLLIGIKPDKVLIYDGKNIIKKTKVVIAIYNKKLCSEGSYQALIHPEMLFND